MRETREKVAEPLIVRTPRLALLAALPNFLRPLLDGQMEQSDASLNVRLVPGWPSDPMARAGLSKHLQAIEDEPQAVLWRIRLIVLPIQRCVIGSINLKGQVDEHGSVGLGWGHEPAYQGQRFATEAAQAVIDWVFTHSEPSRVWAEISNDNQPSLRVARRLNMQPCENVDFTTTLWQLLRDT